MSLLGPVFGAEARVQAAVTGLVQKTDAEEVRANVAKKVKSTPAVIYTYALSPFSAEALKVLDGAGYQYEKVEVGLEWFTLGGEGSAVRLALASMDASKSTSLPKCFIGGESVGGLSTGGEGGTGIAGLAESGDLVKRLKKAKAKAVPKRK